MKKVGSILLIFGILILFISVFADSIGLGTSPGYGSKQIAGTIVGVVAIVAGLIIMKK